MTKRQGVLASATVDVPADTSGAKTHVSAEVRCHWPPAATDEQIKTALKEAYWKAVIEIERGTDGRQL